MPIRAVFLLLSAALLAGCGTISERSAKRADVLCSGPFEDMATCHSAAARYCGDKKVDVLYDYSVATPPQRRLLIACR